MKQVGALITFASDINYLILLIRLSIDYTHLVSDNNLKPTKVPCWHNMSVKVFKLCDKAVAFPLKLFSNPPYKIVC